MQDTEQATVQRSPRKKATTSGGAALTADPSSTGGASGIAILTLDQIKHIVREVFAEQVAKLAPPSAPKPPRCTIELAAEQLGCCVRHVRRLLKIGDLQGTRIGSRVYVTQQSIDELLTKETV